MLTFIQARARFASVAARAYTADELAVRLLMLGYSRSVSGRTARQLAWALAYHILQPDCVDYVALRSDPHSSAGVGTPDYTPEVK